MTQPRRVCVALLAILLFGCAGDTGIRLAPSIDLERSITGGDGRLVVVVAPFRDERRFPDRCGVRKSVTGGEVGIVRCDSDPTRWIAEFLAERLKHAGFEVVPDRTNPLVDVVTIEGALLQLFVEPVLGGEWNFIETDIQLRLLVQTSSGLKASRVFFSKEIAEPADPRRRGGYQKSFERAASQIASDSVTAIVELTERYPQVGRTRGPTDAR